MRNLMTVGLKLLGILSVYWAIFETVQFVLFLLNAAHGGPFQFGEWWGILFSLLMSAIRVFFAVVLLTRTNWIIERLNLPMESPSPPVMEPAQLLRVGLVVLGAYAVIEAFPEMGRDIYVLSQSKLSMLQMPNYGLDRCIAAVLKFILGCIVIGRSNRFARNVFPIPEPQP
jgi:hypothetical protein